MIPESINNKNDLIIGYDSVIKKRMNKIERQKMKTVKPMNNISKEETLIVDGHEITPFTKEVVEQTFPKEEFIDDNTVKNQTIENLMDEIIKQKDDRIQVTVSLTKRQYDLYTKKGGESWLKKALIGQGNKRKK